jgi:hypothetical protein
MTLNISTYLENFFRNFGTYLIQLHYILVSFYYFSIYDPVLLEPNPVVKRVLFWSRFTTSFYVPVLLEPNPVVKRVLPVFILSSVDVSHGTRCYVSDMSRTPWSRSAISNPPLVIF